LDGGVAVNTLSKSGSGATTVPKGWAAKTRLAEVVGINGFAKRMITINPKITPLIFLSYRFILIAPFGSRLLT
jgi:hypothetical protein